MLRPGGRLGFLTIEPRPGLPAADRRRANRIGPPGVAVPTSYPSMLHTAGFVDVAAVDLTSQYRSVLAAWLDAIGRRETGVRAIVGDTTYDERMMTRTRSLAAVDEGLLARFRYTATRPPSAGTR